MTAEEPFLTIELEPIDPSMLRATEGTSVWETVRGKRNRITIGRPRWLDPAEVLDADILAKLRRENQLNEQAAKVMRLSLTLLPDPQCRFRSADLILTLAGGASFVHLEPREQLSSLAVTTTRAGAHAKFTVLSFGEVGVHSGTRATNLTRSEATIEAFGTGSAEAGWRLSTVSTRDIPLESPDLSAVVVQQDRLAGSVQIGAVAEINVLTVGDKWLTWAFKRARPEAALAHPLPQD
jgi:hypothetical protein